MKRYYFTNAYGDTILPDYVGSKIKAILYAESQIDSVKDDIFINNDETIVDVIFK